VLTKDLLTDGTPSTDASAIVVDGDDDCPSPLLGTLCSATSPALLVSDAVVLSADPTTGVPTWARSNPNRVALSVGGTISQVTLQVTNYLLVDTTQSDPDDPANVVNLTPPADGCGVWEVYVKNINALGTVLHVTSSGGETIDGQTTIDLDGPATGGYPFGNDGGESAHLVWSPCPSVVRALSFILPKWSELVGKPRLSPASG
jgi:hypothetical protein